MSRKWARSLLCYLASAGVALAVVACDQAAVATPRPETITIAGATALHPVLDELTAEFSLQHPNILFSVRGGGSTLGEEQVQAGRINLAASSLLPPEAGTARARLVRIPIGIDGLAIIVHSGNNVPGLTMEELREIYRGRLFEWQEVGGPPGEIVLVSREDGSGARLLFEDVVMGDEAVSLTAVVMPTSEDVVEYVAKTPYAIGYVSRAFVVEQLKRTGGNPTAQETPSPLNGVRPLPINELLPTDEALRNQSYPLIQPLYLVSRRQPTGWVRQFTDFVLSPRGQAIVGRYHLRVR